MKILLFDVDWTLIKGDNKINVDAFNYAFKTVYNLPHASKTDIKTNGLLVTQIILEVLAVYAISERSAKEKMSEAIKAMEEYYVAHEHEEEYVPLPGVFSILTQLKQKQIPLGILSGNIEKVAWRKLALAGLKDFFDFGSFGDLAFKRVDLLAIAKQRASEQCNIDAPLSDFILIGDSPPDIHCAREAGIQVIAVATGNYSFQELFDVGADLVVTSLQEEERIFAFLNSTPG